MGKIRAKIEKINENFIIKLHKQLIDHLGLKDDDEVEFELKKVFPLEEEAIDVKRDIKIKMIPSCFKYGIITLSTKDRELFPQDRHPFLLEIDGKSKTKHVASLKIAMNDFFDIHPELKPTNREERYFLIKVIEPFRKYKFVY